MRKMRNSHGRTWNIARNTEKCAKREKHCRAWNMKKIMKNVKNEKYTL
jgi:hypothetical protein